jgi:hypothetical protein
MEKLATVVLFMPFGMVFCLTGVLITIIQVMATPGATCFVILCACCFFFFFLLINTGCFISRCFINYKSYINIIINYIITMHANFAGSLLPHYMASLKKYIQKDRWGGDRNIILGDDIFDGLVGRS